MPTAHSSLSPATVYFIQAGRRGPIKIGLTRGDIRRRVHTLRVSAPCELRLIGTIPHAAARAESEIQERFASLRLRGEWFRPKPELLDYIAGHATPADAPAAGVESGRGEKRHDPLSEKPRGRPADAERTTKADYLRALRLRHVNGLTEADAARLMGVTRKTLRAWCRRAAALPEGRQIIADPLV